MPFGKYKGKTIDEIYKEDAQYVFWLANSDRYFRIDFASLTGIDLEDEQAQIKFEREIERPTKIQVRITNLDKKQVRLCQRLLE